MAYKRIVMTVQEAVSQGYTQRTLADIYRKGYNCVAIEEAPEEPAKLVDYRNDADDTVSIHRAYAWTIEKITDVVSGYGSHYILTRMVDTEKEAWRGLSYIQ